MYSRVVSDYIFGMTNIVFQIIMWSTDNPNQNHSVIRVRVLQMSDFHCSLSLSL